MLTNPCPVGGTQVSMADPHGPNTTCPACGRQLNVPDPSPSLVWPEHRARWPEHERLLGGQRRQRPAPRPSTPVEEADTEAGAFAAGWVVGETFDLL